MQLRANGHEVDGFGERKTPSPFVNACTTFLYLDNLDGADAPVTPAEPADEVVQKQKAARAQPAPPAKAGKSLAMDTKLVTILRGAVEAVARDDGWAAMSAAGSAAKRQAPIDPRNYGARNFPALFEATGLFEIVKCEGGNSFVADKHNKDRAAKPAP